MSNDRDTVMQKFGERMSEHLIILARMRGWSPPFMDQRTSAADLWEALGPAIRTDAYDNGLAMEACDILAEYLNRVPGAT